MNKIWIPVVLFALIISGGFLYNGYVAEKTDEMLRLSEKAYATSTEESEKCLEYLDEIDKRLENISALLCAFLDRDIINEAQDAIVSAKGLADAGSINLQSGIGYSIVVCSIHTHTYMYSIHIHLCTYILCSIV